MTPEAIEPLFEKQMDGFSIAFHMLSYAKIGTSTIQSRATAGVAAGKLIFALPGSTAAVELAMSRLIVPELSHALGQLRQLAAHAVSRASKGPVSGQS